MNELLLGNPVLQKLKDGIEITEAEAEQLAVELHDEHPHITIDLLRRVYNNRKAVFVQFIKHILGIEVLHSFPETVAKAFDDFIATHNYLTSRQLQFLDLLRKFIIENGVLTRKNLIESPFTLLHPEGIRGIFNPKEIEEILRRHYTPVLKLKAWHYPFTHKTTIITDLHSFCQKVVGEKNLASLQNAVLSQIMPSLRECQGLRKNMVALYEERIPRLQWFLLGFLAVTILINLFIFPSHFEFLSSLLKGAFGAILVFVLIFLRKLDRLEFFEGAIGESSARDVLNIIEGKR